MTFSAPRTGTIPRDVEASRLVARVDPLLDAGFSPADGTFADTQWARKPSCCNELVDR